MKIVFYFGVMNSAKTAQLLMSHHMYLSKGIRPLLIKPSIDNRDGVKAVSSRVGLSYNADFTISKDTDIKKKLDNFFNSNSDDNPKIIMIDEVQFIDPAQAHYIAMYARKNNISVMLYGLLKTFQNKLFEGSEAWIEEADTLNEIKTTCSVPGCERKASRNLRLSDGKAVYSGDTIQIGGEESYTSVCAKHWINYPSNL